MFNNLIESTSHAKEFKRRGSFLLFTTATYLVLFVVTGVISIYAYDARLEEQSLELVTLISPQDIAPQQDPAPTQPNTPRDASNNPHAIIERADAMLSVNHPEVPPPTIGTIASPNPPIPDAGTYAITGRNYDPGPAGGPPSPAGSGGRVAVPARQVVVTDDNPPPPPEPPKPPKVVSKGVITGLAIYLPKPAYTEIARRARAQGSVSVQVLIDESGRVVSAKALSGSPFLTLEAQKAALQARFAPTLLSNQPVKVSGVITYNFVLGN
ncbi:MAG TPA: energy transducer TonB [Pyrinomonadaceae bacterium]|jgi:protein TonB|nr:energy transducer TonB [Pyrinomonadaceae bacterium]